MKKNWLAVTTVAVIALAIVAYKQWVQAPTPVRNTTARIAKSGTSLSLLLVADPTEADESDGCGQIIRMVRTAGARGIPLRELAPHADPVTTSRYRIVVSPTDLVMADGKVLKRYEGESPETVGSIRAEMGVLEAHR